MAERDTILKDYFLTIHKVISRSINTSVENIRIFIDSGFPDEQTRQGFLNFIRLTGLMLDSHHLTEDDIGFPYFEKDLPNTHFEWLHEDHNLITGFLKELTPIMDIFEKTDTTQENLKDIEAVLLKIEDRWNQHVGLEEEEFINIIDTLAPYEDRVKLIDQFFDFNEDLLQPYHLSLPFMLYNLGKEDRNRWSKGYSRDLLKKVETVSWKEKWGSMKPFFLE